MCPSELIAFILCLSSTQVRVACPFGAINTIGNENASTSTKYNESMRQRSKRMHTDTPKWYRRNESLSLSSWVSSICGAWCVCECVCASHILTSNSPKNTKRKKLNIFVVVVVSLLAYIISFFWFLGVDRLWTWSPLSCVHVVNIQCIKIKLKCMIFSLRRSREKRTNDTERGVCSMLAFVHGFRFVGC